MTPRAGSLARPRLRKRALLSVVAALVSVAPAATPAIAATVSPPDRQLAVPSLHWTSCGSPFQCATAIVPLDYDKPTGSKISLALIRLPASDPTHRIGSIFINPGGPGGSGVDTVRGGGQSLFSRSVRARFDLVGFDPRGIAASTPLRCFDNLDDALGALPPFSFPVGLSEENVLHVFDTYLADSCAQRGGAILDHMATADVARDLDLLRAA
ncbi:MAG: hypothetical protein QOI55_2057, partial [Actinomycetota bacterium]|nr:hypothetical protein [Actinomycetota bacterium]